MFIADYHIHTNYSSDCNVLMENIIKHAIKLGLKEIAFTDHVDYDYPNPECAFLINYDEYLLELNSLKEQYENQIKIIFGVEIGLQPHINNKNIELVNKYPFDFVIGSIHAADKLDFYNGDFFKGKEQKNAYLRYFENVLENIKEFKEFNVCGHLDFIIRYGEYNIKKLSYLDYSAIIDAILKNIIEKGIGIEINTSGYRYKLNQTHPQLSIIKRYKELGGEIITVGSDSHRAEDLCSHFKEAYDILKLVGFGKIALFRKKTPTFIKI